MAVWDSAEHRARSPYSHPWLAEAVDALDERLRRSQAVFEYTDNPNLRISARHHPRRPLNRAARRNARARRPSGLRGCTSGTSRFRRCRKMARRSRWARHMQRAMLTSLRELARFLAARPDLRDIAVIAGDVPSGTADQREQLARIMARFGFEAVIDARAFTDPRAPAPLWGKYPDFADRFRA